MVASTLRLPREDLDRLVIMSLRQSLEAGRQVTVQDLIRECIKENLLTAEQSTQNKQAKT